MGFVWKVIDGNKSLLNEISRITVLLPIERARASGPIGPGEANTLLHFAIAVDTFVKGITLLSKEKDYQSVGEMVRSEPGPIERLASFAAWLLEVKVATKAASPQGECIASTIGTFRKEMYPVGSAVHAAMHLYLDEEDRYVAIRDRGGNDGGKVARTLIHALHDVLGLRHPSGFTISEAHQMSYVAGLLANQSDTLLAD